MNRQEQKPRRVGKEITLLRTIMRRNVKNGLHPFCIVEESKGIGRKEMQDKKIQRT